MISSESRYLMPDCTIFATSMRQRFCWPASRCMWSLPDSAHGPSITLRVYAHVISDQLTEAADIFARAVSSTS